MNYYIVKKDKSGHDFYEGEIVSNVKDNQYMSVKRGLIRYINYPNEIEEITETEAYNILCEPIIQIKD